MQMEGHYFVLTGSAMKEICCVNNDLFLKNLVLSSVRNIISVHSRLSGTGDVWAFEAKPRTPLVDQIVRGLINENLL